MSQEQRLFISFSGGETSALMTKLILERWSNLYDKIVVVFANTGQENEETLSFVDWCDKHLFAPKGHRVVWVEADVQIGRRAAPKARVVTYETASRNGEPFESVISKYGIPNQKFPQCTRDLKLNPLKDYIRSIGWEAKSYDTAIGIRADEIDRCSVSAKSNRVVYPLAFEWPTTKPEVNTFWRSQPRRLNLKGYEGNCKWCWKKSLRKHYTLIKNSPEIYDFPRRMEATYGLVGPEFKKENVPGYRRTFFRGNKSVDDLFAEAKALGAEFIPAPDDANVFVRFDESLDVGGDCDGGESCEVNYDDSELEDLI